tara:strand:- start:436 stop:810 length:375 start_codon:yes stop_codon:yes gene_type:complete
MRCRVTTAATPPRAAARALCTTSKIISVYTAIRMAKDAGTAQLGISGGSHNPEGEEAARTEGMKMVSNRRTYATKVTLPRTVSAMFIVHPSDILNMRLLATGTRKYFDIVTLKTPWRVRIFGDK